MAQCVVRNSTFHGTVEATGSYAGGIVGGGYDNQTAPNGACPTILACTVDGTVKGNERVGGIFGGDGFVAQTWDNVVGSMALCERALVPEILRKPLNGWFLPEC